MGRLALRFHAPGSTEPGEAGFTQDDRELPLDTCSAIAWWLNSAGGAVEPVHGELPLGG
jgi:hypothetical protein